MSMDKFGIFLSILAIIATFSAATYTMFGKPQPTFSQTAGEMTGYAWSSNIGWISLNCLTGSTTGTSVCGTSNYRIAIDAEGLMSGYAWSSNIGLIQAYTSDTGCPSGTGCAARMEDNNMRGWMRALSNGGGWDGWISLSSTSSPAYGPTLSGTAFSGFAWGDDVVGWIDFQYADTDWAPCTVTYICPDQTHYDNVCTTTINENIQCGAGLICSPGVIPCVTPADANGTLTLSPQLVPTGNTTEISWDVEGTVSCVVTSDQGPPGWELTGADEGAGTSHVISETTIFTLTCTNELDEDPTEVDTATAVVVPTWVER